MTTGIQGEKSRHARLISIPTKHAGQLIVAIAALFLASVPPAQSADAQGAQPSTWEEFDTLAQSFAPVVSVLAAEVADGKCKSIYNLNGEMTTPIGSSFKLYILAEVAAQIDLRPQPLREPSKTDYPPRSPLTWGMPLKIQPEHKAIPGGPLLFVPDGSRFTLRYLAEQMIQRSDNTATDHLLFLAGRKNVERRMALTGHHDPSLNTPLVATREFAIMKFLWSDEQLQNYEQASTEERRRFLATEQRGWPELEALFEKNGDQTKPERVETVEWYANRFDICKLMIFIHQMGRKQSLQPLLEVLTLRDPISFDREDWIYVGFKGGSEVGLQVGNWLVQRNDGRLFFFSAAFLDPDQALDLGNIIPLLEAVPKILFATP